jgi:hypothetical protein
MAESMTESTEESLIESMEESRAASSAGSNTVSMAEVVGFPGVWGLGGYARLDSVLDPASTLPSML